MHIGVTELNAGPSHSCIFFICKTARPCASTVWTWNVFLLRSILILTMLIGLTPVLVTWALATPCWPTAGLRKRGESIPLLDEPLPTIGIRFEYSSTPNEPITEIDH